MTEYDYQSPSPVVARRYFYGEYVDEPIAMIDHTGADGSVGADIYHYHRNALYSVVALSDNTGAVQERYAYGPYGETTFHDADGTLRDGTVTGKPKDRSALGNPYLYTGRRWPCSEEPSVGPAHPE